MKFWVLCCSIVIFIAAAMFTNGYLKNDNIKVGLLYSQNGTMATSEIPVAEMFRAAVDEINDQGGILGKKVEILEFDGRSDPQEFQKGAQTLIDQGAISLFGCWTSASRKKVKEIVEKNNSILFYPVQYEGFENSPNIIYLGLSANQQINPTLDFIQTHFGKNIYLIGSDYIYPRAANHYIKELSHLTELEVVAEKYVKLGTHDFGEIFDDILEKKPHAIINTLNGDSNIDFFRQLKEHGIGSKEIPVFSLSLDESIIAQIETIDTQDLLSGHYATWGYFNVMNENITNDFTLFLKRYFHKDKKVTDAMFSIYLGLQLFKKSLLRAQETTPEALLNALKRESFYLSDNIYFIDPDNFHTHRNVMIGKINQRQHVDIVWRSSQIIKPNPYPTFKSKDEWERCLQELNNEIQCYDATFSKETK